MSRPPKKAVEQIKAYCEKTQCRRCVYGKPENYGEFVGCMLQQTTPCDWEVEEESEAKK